MAFSGSLGCPSDNRSRHHTLSSTRLKEHAGPSEMEFHQHGFLFYNTCSREIDPLYDVVYRHVSGSQPCGDTTSPAHHKEPSPECQALCLFLCPSQLGPSNAGEQWLGCGTPAALHPDQCVSILAGQTFLAGVGANMC